MYQYHYGTTLPQQIFHLYEVLQFICFLKSISRVQFSPSAHTRRDFFLRKKMISGKLESVS